MLKVSQSVGSEVVILIHIVQYYILHEDFKDIRSYDLFVLQMEGREFTISFLNLSSLK